MKLHLHQQTATCFWPANRQRKVCVEEQEYEPNDKQTFKAGLLTKKEEYEVNTDPACKQ